MLRYFSPPCNETVRAAMADPTTGLSMIATPSQGNTLTADGPLIGDNGRYGKGWPGYGKWVSFLETLAPHRDRMWFATAPDVANPDLGHELAKVSTAESIPWLPIIRSFGLPSAFVAQNGLTADMVPWEQVDVLFLGGFAECVPCGWTVTREELANKRRDCPTCGRTLTEWKLGAAAYGLCREATARGLRIHMGRVNSLERMQAAVERGCQSVDGTLLTNGPDKHLPPLLQWLRLINQRLPLFEQGAA